MVEKKATKKSGATLKVSRCGSYSGCTDGQRGALIGLGLNRMNKVRELEDTPAIRGMIRKVRHLVKVHGEE